MNALKVSIAAALMLSAPPVLAAELRGWGASGVRQTVSQILVASLSGQPPLGADPERLPQALRAPAGVFITVSRAGVVRGCWGRLAPTRASVAEELVSVAARLRTADWRNRPIDDSEWPQLVAHVSVVGALVPIARAAALDPRRHGLWLTAGGRGGVVLPGEAASSAWQELLCRRKAGLSSRHPARLYRFETELLGPISLAAVRRVP
ncbi:MAG: AMMECR1 domain-containing protein [Candidatus Sericytochromatia bacterium]|nr:AMMECR1 domain-containing protein [Candidatus Sericytochromatia bacterium]